MELSKVTMILRGYTYEQVRCVAEVLINSSYGETGTGTAG